LADILIADKVCLFIVWCLTLCFDAVGWPAKNGILREKSPAPAITKGLLLGTEPA